MPADYQRQVIVFGDFEGEKLPIMLDFEGRVVYLSSDWVAYTPVTTWSDGTPENLTATGRYKRMGNVGYYEFSVFGNTGIYDTKLLTVSLPIARIGNIPIVFTGLKYTPPYLDTIDPVTVAGKFNPGGSSPAISFGSGISGWIDFGTTVTMSGSYPV